MLLDENFIRIERIRRNNKSHKVRYYSCVECKDEFRIFQCNLKTSNGKCTKCRRRLVLPIGSFFGHLQVKEMLGIGKRRLGTTLCVCDCGSERIVETAVLKRGKITSCNNCSLTDIKVNWDNLKNLVPVSKTWIDILRGLDAMWEHLLRLKRELNKLGISYSHITDEINGYSGIPVLKKIDSLGTKRKTIGKLKKERTVYIFKCLECGQNMEIQGSNVSISSGKCDPCSSKKRPFEYLLTCIEASCNRGTNLIPFDLTYKDLLIFTKIKECHYCSVPIGWLPHSTSHANGKKRSSHAYNLDRKNPNLGYSLSNCVVCCKSCNYTKQIRYTYEEFLILAPALRKITELRKNKNEQIK